MYLSVLSNVMIRGLDYIGIFLGLLIQCIFTIHRPGGVKLGHLRVNQESEAPASEHTDVGTGTLEKDFGMSTHAGGLFPNGHRSWTMTPIIMEGTATNI